MDRYVVRNMVNHFDKETIALPSNDTRARELAIDGHHALGVAQTGHILQLNLKMILKDHILISTKPIKESK